MNASIVGELECMSYMAECTPIQAMYVCQWVPLTIALTSQSVTPIPKPAKTIVARQKRNKLKDAILHLYVHVYMHNKIFVEVNMHHTMIYSITYTCT